MAGQPGRLRLREIVGMPLRAEQSTRTFAWPGAVPVGPTSCHNSTTFMKNGDA
jgi:hypothetical protein